RGGGRALGVGQAGGRRDRRGRGGGGAAPRRARRRAGPGPLTAGAREGRRARRVILVTGATGTNGHLVVNALLQAGQPVRAMVQAPGRAGDLRQAGAQLIAADFDRAETLDTALAGVERALLLSPVDVKLVERETRFVERARKAGLRHLVKFSAIG